MPPSERADSILSHGERDVAGHFREDPDASVESVAAARGVPEEAVEQAIERVRGKTRRAFQTLAESPFTDAVAEELDEDTRTRLRRALQDEST